MTQQLDKAIQAEWKVALYRNIFGNALVIKFMLLIKELAKTIPNPSQTMMYYYDFAAAFIPQAAIVSTDSGNAWQDYLLKLILLDENLFSLQAEKVKSDLIPEPIRRMAARDLQLLQSLAAISGDYLKKLTTLRLGKIIAEDELPEWDGLGAGAEPQVMLGEDWGQSLDVFSAYYHRNGVGLFGQYHAFRWVKAPGGEGRLTGVRNLDSIKISQLYEYEREQAKVIENTEHFLAGYAANNVLLYGDRGTGKSSTVKALVNQYASSGLRLIEVQKQDLEDFPAIIAQLAERPQRCIIFIDDLSFTQDEGEYRELKALLEGSLEAKPGNVLVYATSNRRHLIQESFSDKKITGYDPDNDDIRFMDTVQEKLSLSDRFGITVTFAAPDQKRFLTIVAKMAQDRGLNIDQNELSQLALRWELNYNSRSARTARQFIDYMEGRLAVQAQGKQ